MQTNNIHISIREILIYVLIGIVSFLVFSIPATTVDSGDFTKAGESKELPTKNFSSISFSTPSQSQRTITTSSGSSLAQILQFFAVVGVIVLVLFLIFYLVNMRKMFSPTLGQKHKTDEERLRFSRENAANILREALNSGDYTNAVIDAYIALDEALNNFRGVERPEHWTPKEYAIFVSPPVFQPTVYSIVDLFYYVRYGMNEANRSDVELFLELLYKIFENEIPAQMKEEMIQSFRSLNLRKELYSIPIKGDLTKPQGGKRK